MCFKRLDVFNHALKENGSLVCTIDTIHSFHALILQSRVKGQLPEPPNEVTNAMYGVRKRWTKCHRSLKRFLAQYGSWLEESVCLPDPVCQTQLGGRPQLPFPAKSRRTKLDATADIRKRHSAEELIFSASSAVYQTGQRKAAQLVEAAGSPRRGPVLAAQLGAKKSCHDAFTVEEALGLIIDNDLTKAQYERLRHSARQKGCQLYPPYKAVAKAKSACLPPAAALTVKPERASSSLQKILDHTAGRLLQLQEECCV